MREVRRISRKSDATREALLDAALTVIARKGYSAATVDEIVKEAGVSKGLAYYHFKNKADLASAVLKKGIAELIGTFERICAQSASAAEALTGMFDSFADAVVDNREFGRFFFSELWRAGRVWSDEMRESESRLVDIIAAQFRRGQAEGFIDPDADAVFSAVSCVGLVLSTALCYFGDNPLGEGIAPQLSKEAFVSQVRAFVHRATMPQAA